MPINKTSFQPKDARAVSQDDDMDDDMDDLFSHSSNGNKKMMTGTQALVEFLKTTSPEEFQKSSNNKSNNIFSRIRKQKRAISTATATTTNPPPSPPTPSLSTRSVQSTLSTVPTFYELNTIHRKNYIEIVPQQQALSPSFETTTSIQSFVLRNNNNNNNNNKGEPILPNKKRESSLYSGSLKHSISTKSQLTNNNNLLLKNTTSDDEMDLIESALLQRLERLKLMNHDIPSDQVATGLAIEHVRALGITHQLDNMNNYDDNKRKKRHMQVQTEGDCQIQQPVVVENLEETEETDTEKRAKRAEAALENALDHFEVISGLAYKKLREIWEEKMRWENACMELRDRLVLLEQKKQQQQHEEDDELGLSEFPCSE